ncbi:MAG TPA: DUF3300 domain-containing protein [Stellaceae bacterium]|nr:DUF3300 domain-containing protein [Stellaceae bacterium]HMD66476.1 DUF3300 domain-containing protein [Stellaceae bacterium]
MVTSPIRVTAGIFALSILASSPVRAQSTPAADTVTLAPPGTEIQAPAAVPAATPPAETSTAGAPAPAPGTETQTTVTPALAPTTATPTAGAPAPTPAAETPPLFRAEQLDQLLAPIALYPDALLAQILMAATYPLEIVKARRWFQDPRHAALPGDALAAAIEAEAWDPSIKALMTFPQILRMMDANLDWTEKVGDAFLAQQADVMDAIQRLRYQAAAAGTLWSNAQQRVTTEGQGIVIEPASPAFIYPPVYNPADVYGPWPYPDYPPLDIVPSDYDVGFALPLGIGFGVGFAVVRPLWRWCAFDWAQRRIRVDADRSNARDGTGPGPESAVWQHDPAHRHGAAYLDPASRGRFGGFRDRAVSVVAFPRVDTANARVVPPTVSSNPAPRTFAPAWTGPVARIQQGRGIAGRQFMAPRMMPRQPVASMMPRAWAPSRAVPAGGNPRFEGASHR